MSYQLGDYVVSGDISNVTRNSVNGWIYFGRDQGLHLQLNGNLSGEFAGKRFRFFIPRDAAVNNADADLPSEIADMPMQQIGVVGSIHFSPDAKHVEKQGDSNGNGDPCFHLEWYSQNGKVVIAVGEAQIEFVEDDEDETGQDKSGEEDSVPPDVLVEQQLREDTDADVFMDDDEDEDDEDPDDPYGLFDQQLQHDIEKSVGSTYVEQEPDDEFVIDDDDEIETAEVESNDSGTRSWDEVIPDIDPDTKAMYEQWDEVFHGAKDEPITNLFDPPIEIPPLNSITTDQQAEPILNAILIRLAPLSVAFDICEHCGPLDAFRILMTEVLPNAHIHPELAKTEIVQHYGTYDYCEQCQKEYDMDFEEKL